MDLLLDTVLLRPYVFVFLTVYLVGASLQFGARTALIFLPLGYSVAFVSELSSIHWGFPYGDYYYIPNTVDRELWILGVPFMDSISYVFLAACSYATALFLVCPFLRDQIGLTLWDTADNRKHWAPWILGSLLMVLLDIIIDPVALRGDRWFLGKIYGYPTPGPYFGVPMSNFAGWLLVALILIKLFQEITALWGKSSSEVRCVVFPIAPLWGPSLYLGIAVFNLVITAAIGETTLCLAGVFLVGTFVTISGALIYYKIRHPLPRSDNASPGLFMKNDDHI